MLGGDARLAPDYANETFIYNRVPACCCYCGLVVYREMYVTGTSECARQAGGEWNRILCNFMDRWLLTCVAQKDYKKREASLNTGPRSVNSSKLCNTTALQRDV